MALRDFELIFKNNPQTNIKDIYYCGNYRISILKEGIVRIEESKSLSFNDLPTQFAINRYFASPNYEYKQTKDGLSFKFEYYTLFFNGNFKNSYILYKNKKMPLKSGKNLGGTYHTLDGYDGDEQIDTREKIKMIDGILTRNGLFIYDDTNSYTFKKDYSFNKKNENIVDYYIFFYPNKYREAIKDFFEISGYPPLLPKYVFGNWWSRYYPYSQGSYLYLLNRFKEEKVPFTVATIDMDWHYSSSNGRNFFKDIGIDEEKFIVGIKNGKKEYCVKGWNEDLPWTIGWTGYTFNKTLFEDPDSMFKTLKDWDYHITLNLHPADGIAFYEDSYKDVLKALNLNYKNNETIEFDLTDDKNRNVYFNNVLLPLAKKGVDFWWIDWQQGENSKYPGLSPLWLCNHYFYLENYRNDNRPLILSRFAGVGSHRYPLGFSGDSAQTFNTLKFSVESTSLASNVGFTYWSHDIGGHFLGYKNSELFLKSVQFGCLSPINRLHCSCSETNNKDFNLYLNGDGELIKKYLRFRHSLIPFIYSHSIKTHFEGKPLLCPIYYDNPESSLSYKYAKNEYIFGDNLLVAPFTKKRNYGDYNKINIAFLDNYYDIHFGYKYFKNTVKSVYRTNDTMPLFLKEGTFLVLDNDDNGNSINNPLNLTILTTTGNGRYDFIEDDDDKKFLITNFTNLKVSDSKNKIIIKFDGNLELLNEKRIMKFRILNAHKLNNVKVDNCKLLKAIDYSGFIEIYVSNFDINKEITIEYTYFEGDQFSKLKRDLLNRVVYLDEDNCLRDELYKVIDTSKNDLDLKESLSQKYQHKWFYALFEELLN